MALQRKARKIGDSLTVGIPAQVAELHGIDEGTILEYQPITRGVFKMIALAKMCKVKRVGSDETRMVEEKDGACIPPKGWEVVK